MIMPNTIVICYILIARLFIHGGNGIEAFSLTNKSTVGGGSGSDNSRNQNQIINYLVSEDSSSSSSSSIRRASLPGHNTNKKYHENTSVEVEVKRDYPTLTSPKEARDVWLSYIWKKGGGLAAWVVPNDNGSCNPDTDITFDVDDEKSKNKNTKLPHRRLILPLFMEEELISIDDCDEDESNEVVLKYIVTDAGLLSSEIVPFTHLGTVIFRVNPDSEEQEGITMTWDVSFDVTESSRQSFWQAFTNKMITDASDNLSSYVATPTVYTRRTELVNKRDLTPKQAMEAWIDFCWKSGGGLPLPPPLCLKQDDNKVRWIIPPFLKERLISATCRSTGGESYGSVCEIQYTVDNPSIVTYQVYSHFGRIRFSNSEQRNDDVNEVISSDSTSLPQPSSSSSMPATLDMIWEIEIRPYRSCSSFVKSFTSMIVSTYARNFACHFSEGDTMVSLKPPRGEFGGESIIRLKKDSWIGGVLYAHLNDNRSVLETISMLQPWTWGRASDDAGEGEIWSEGHLE